MSPTNEPTPEFISYKKALDRCKQYGTVSLITEPPSVLERGEEVVLVLLGLARDFPHMVMVTDRRLLKLDLGVIFGPPIEVEIPLNEVQSATFGSGPFGKVRIQSAGRKDVEIFPNCSDEARRFIQELDVFLRTGQRPTD